MITKTTTTGMNGIELQIVEALFHDKRTLIDLLTWLENCKMRKFWPDNWRQ